MFSFFFLEKVLDEKIHEYEIGRRHLAKIMGEDPESFTQDKIDVGFSQIELTFFSYSCSRKH